MPGRVLHRRAAVEQHKHLGIAASTRLSVGIYNTIEEINLLPSAIEHAQHVLATT